MAVVLFVRVESDLDSDELDRRVEERRPQFLEVPGLLQKIYGRDATGAYCGIYFFEDREALAAFRDSALAKTIPSAYEAREIRREVYDVLFPLRPERGLFAARWKEG
ncbi:MAG TPA: YdhR family protein [Thermoanaerobaculia bacterium]|nr:YdhR family protein [Thermoanaerobaculia bacterium]